jgi:sugar/nucleoside kinase (ribokinase family)
MFRSYDIFHIEGYLVQNYELIETAVHLARKEGLEVSLDMASFNVVEQHIDFLRKIVAEGVDIIFANEEEAKAFTGEAPETAVESLARMSRTAIVKTGVGGSLVRDAKGLHRVPSFLADVRDTTGAGDIYASGFLYGYIRGLHPERSGRIGSLLAARVIEYIGAKIPDAVWSELLKQVAEIESAD